MTNKLEKIYKVYVFTADKKCLLNELPVPIPYTKDDIELSDLLTKFDPYYKDQIVNDESWDRFLKIIDIFSSNANLDLFIFKVDNIRTQKISPTYIVPEHFKDKLPTTNEFSAYQYNKDDHTWTVKERDTTSTNIIQLSYYTNLTGNSYNYTLQSLIETIKKEKSEFLEERILKPVKSHANFKNLSITEQTEFLKEIELGANSKTPHPEALTEEEIKRMPIKYEQLPYNQAYILNHPAVKSLKTKNIPIIKSYYNSFKFMSSFASKDSNYKSMQRDMEMLITGTPQIIEYTNSLLIETYAKWFKLQKDIGPIRKIRSNLYSNLNNSIPLKPDEMLKSINFNNSVNVIQFQLHEVIKHLVKLIDSYITITESINNQTKRASKPTEITAQAIIDNLPTPSSKVLSSKEKYKLKKLLFPDIIESIGELLNQKNNDALKKEYDLTKNDIELLDYLNRMNNHIKHSPIDMTTFPNNILEIMLDINSSGTCYRHIHRVDALIAGFNSVFYKLMHKKIKDDASSAKTT